MNKNEQLEFDFGYASHSASVAESRRVTRMSDEEFATFFERFKKGEVISSRSMQAKDLGKVFLGIDMGYFADFTDEDYKSVGQIYNYIDECLPNKKYTCFMTFKLLHVDDADKLEKKLASLLSLGEVEACED